MEALKASVKELTRQWLWKLHLHCSLSFIDCGAQFLAIGPLDETDVDQSILKIKSKFNLHPTVSVNQIYDRGVGQIL